MRAGDRLTGKEKRRKEGDRRQSQGRASRMIDRHKERDSNVTLHTHTHDLSFVPPPARTSAVSNDGSGSSPFPDEYLPILLRYREPFEEDRINE
jgi:hypothetical protein